MLIAQSWGAQLPTYAYSCGACGHGFELRQGFDAIPEHECPRCHGKARRVFHPVGVIYKGSGFYSTDYRKPSSASAGDLPGTADSSSSTPDPD